jgi:DNA-binding transcriptional ArsR family regulator/uncharacterized protein YndB with AHSA1/START domain
MSDLQSLVEALASPTRREILWLVWDRERAAGELATSVGLSAPTISEHLRVLRRAGLIHQRKAGTFRYYVADKATVALLQSRVMGENAKWRRTGLADATTSVHADVQRLVRLSVDVACSPVEAFTAFTDPAIYSAWLGVPVTIDAGRFACTMESGFVVRGTYDLVVPSQLIVMRWDFDPVDIPVPGGQLDAYLRVRSAPAGSQVAVDQHAPDDAAAARLSRIWSLVLGRFADWVGATSA